MSRIQIALRHLTTAEADAAWAEVHSEAGSDLADNLAVTIASWWQGPGRHLAALASGAPVSAEALAADVEATLAELPPAPPDRAADSDSDAAQLAWLAEWVADWAHR